MADVLVRAGLARRARFTATTVTDDTTYPITPAAKGFGQRIKPIFASVCASPLTIAPESGRSNAQRFRRARAAFGVQDMVATPAATPMAANATRNVTFSPR